MDDTTLLTNELGIRNSPSTPEASQVLEPQSLIGCTRANTQKYSQILWTSGGQLAPDKCNVYLLKPKWRKDKCTFEPNAKFPGSVEVWVDPSDPTETPLNQLEPTEAYRTLGIYIAPDTSNRTQTAILAQ